MIEMEAQRAFRGNSDEGMIAKGQRFHTTPSRAPMHEDAGRAVRVDVEGTSEDESDDTTTKEQSPTEATTTEPVSGREWEANGAWKALIVDGEKVASVRATAEEANAWVRGELTTEDLKG